MIGISGSVAQREIPLEAAALTRFGKLRLVEVTAGVAGGGDAVDFTVELHVQGTSFAVSAGTVVAGYVALEAVEVPDLILSGGEFALEDRFVIDFSKHNALLAVSLDNFGFSGNLRFVGGDQFHSGSSENEDALFSVFVADDDLGETAFSVGRGLDGELAVFERRTQAIGGGGCGNSRHSGNIQRHRLARLDHSELTLVSGDSAVGNDSGDGYRIGTGAVIERDFGFSGS